MFNKDIYKHIIEEYIPFHKILGIELLEMENGFASFFIPFKPELVGDPRTNRIHGGVISTAMDAAGGAAGMTTLGSEKDQISTIDIRVDYLYPGKPEAIITEGRIVRDGKNVIFTKMNAHHPKSKEIIAEGRAVYRVKRISDG
ncbi:MAG: hotdog fold thioesterase [Bacteroidota bacterium]